ncbi:MAG: aminoglycoside 6-adenylyltransferase [Chloroflexi bacterium]|nr:aminoglycoside 6-adenylyltransferase [Chloroflexota bacterium]MCI0581030.1 aminoglycoside 6-adenylyltransferase [Chloroflexota bacterium]MCI0646369.1 aminoglycoside 6-adenylyltransferase [Chloroflexota bacterium]MCI0728373.1 aminoglycoside 6-adenylyltransferase [Chloroflexota bacterium]
MMSLTQLQTNALAWAGEQPDLRAVVLVGSQAREDQPADAYADVDLVLFVLDPAVYAASAEWLATIGPLWLAVPNRTGRGDPEWLALFAGGYKVDFVFTSIQAGETLQQALAAFLEQWADPRAVAALPDTFARYDAADLRRALLATLDLLDWLAAETATLWSYPYPTTGQQATLAWLRTLLGL